MLFIISGPSGCGKSTLVKRVLEEMDDVDFSVSFTTRAKRENEVQGIDYFFVDLGIIWGIISFFSGRRY